MRLILAEDLTDRVHRFHPGRRGQLRILPMEEGSSIFD